MRLELESGAILESPTEADLSRIGGEEFAILSKSGGTYMQCAEPIKASSGYLLEYQEGSLQQHYQAMDEQIALERVLVAFKKYLDDDPSWKEDFRWERMELP